MAFARQLRPEEQRKLLLHLWCWSTEFSGRKKIHHPEYLPQPLAPGVGGNAPTRNRPESRIIPPADGGARRSARAEANWNKGGSVTGRRNKPRALPCLHRGIFSIFETTEFSRRQNSIMDVEASVLANEFYIRLPFLPEIIHRLQYRDRGSS